MGVDFIGIGSFARYTLLAHGHYIYTLQLAGTRLPEMGLQPRNHGLRRRLRLLALRNGEEEMYGQATRMKGVKQQTAGC